MTDEDFIKHVFVQDEDSMYCVECECLRDAEEIIDDGGCPICGEGSAFLKVYYVMELSENQWRRKPRVLQHGEPIPMNIIPANPSRTRRIIGG